MNNVHRSFCLSTPSTWGDPLKWMRCTQFVHIFFSKHGGSNPETGKNTHFVQYEFMHYSQGAVKICLVPVRSIPAPGKI